MWPLIALVAGAVIFAKGLAYENEPQVTVKKIPIGELPDKIRFFDDGKDISTRQWQKYEQSKWHSITEKEFDFLFVYGGGNDDVEYYRKKKIEDGKFVYYLRK